MGTLAGLSSQVIYMACPETAREQQRLRSTKIPAHASGYSNNRYSIIRLFDERTVVSDAGPQRQVWRE
jgi:hypothetical protein